VSQLWSRICRAAVLAPCMGLSPHQLRWCLPPRRRRRRGRRL